jgi:hypothetical protein
MGQSPLPFASLCHSLTAQPVMMWDVVMWVEMMWVVMMWDVMMWVVMGDVVIYVTIGNMVMGHVVMMLQALMMLDVVRQVVHSLLVGHWTASGIKQEKRRSCPYHYLQHFGDCSVELGDCGHCL